MSNNLEKASALFEKWVKSKTISYENSKSESIAFAAYCLDEREKETGFKDFNGTPIMFGDTIESFDSQGKPIRHIIEKDPKTGLAKATYGERLSGDLRQNWIDEFQKVIVK